MKKNSLFTIALFIFFAGCCEDDSPTTDPTYPWSSMIDGSIYSKTEDLSGMGTDHGSHFVNRYFTVVSFILPGKYQTKEVGSSNDTPRETTPLTQQLWDDNEGFQFDHIWIYIIDRENDNARIDFYIYDFDGLDYTRQIKSISNELNSHLSMQSGQLEDFDANITYL